MDTGSNALTPIFNQGIVNGALTEEDIQKIQRKLWALLGQRTERYTMGESSSVTVEMAEELLKSICFTISAYLKVNENAFSVLLERGDIERLMQAGWLELEGKIKTGKILLREVFRSAVQVENISYRDTLANIGTFFKKYDYRFFAHCIPADIDYQLCCPVPDDFLGIEYINEYLRRLLLENRFCNCFEMGTLTFLWQCYCPDYKGLLINLFDPVAVNAIGLAMSGGELLPLNITPFDRRRLIERFKAYPKSDAMEQLTAAADQVCVELSLEDVSMRNYLRQTAADLYPRISAALPTGKLDGIFLSIY